MTLMVFVAWLFGFLGKGGGEKEEERLAVPSPAAERLTLSPEKEPRIRFELSGDRSGGTLIIEEIDPSFVKLEYELIYLARDNGGEIERGVAGGPIKIEGGEVREKILFGTESCTTGVCRRHIDKNVSRGNLVLRLIDNEGKSWLVERSFDWE